MYLYPDLSGCAATAQLPGMVIIYTSKAWAGRVAYPGGKAMRRPEMRGERKVLMPTFPFTVIPAPGISRAKNLSMNHIIQSMARRIIIAAALIIASVTAVSAQGQYALLTHDGQTTVFRGPNALIEANNKAMDGDMITLSEGSFTGLGISKSIVLRGAGMGLGTAPRTTITYNEVINGKYEYFSLRIQLPEDGEVTLEDLTFAGDGIVIGSGNRVDVIRCNTNIRFGADINSVRDMRIINCLIGKEIDNMRGADNLPKIYGSVINGAAKGVQANNCVFKGRGEYSNLVNCILIDYRYSNGLTDTYNHCVFISSLDEGFDHLYDTDYTAMLENAPDCKMVKKGTPVFTDTGFYNLLDEYATDWLGNDGTQVGIYGGPFPFQFLRPGLKIRSLKVPEQTTIDGILNVNIEVE